MNKVTIDHEKIFNEFWKDLVCNSDGSLNVEQVKKELADFHYVMEQVPKVYCHITGNTLSKLMYSAETVIKIADDHTEQTTGNIFHFDCWKKDGILEEKTVRALNIENAKTIFESKYPDYGYDEPY